MGTRARIRVGRDVNYRPTDAEAVAGNGVVGAVWSARISNVNANGSVNLFVYEADGGTIPLTAILRGGQKGQFDLLGTGPQAF